MKAVRLAPLTPNSCPAFIPKFIASKNVHIYITNLKRVLDKLDAIEYDGDRQTDRQTDQAPRRGPSTKWGDAIMATRVIHRSQAKNKNGDYKPSNLFEKNGVRAASYNLDYDRRYGAIHKGGN